MILGISTGIKIYNGVVAAAKAVQMAWNLAMTANPIGLIVAGIAALIAGIVLLVKNFDTVKAGFKAMVNLCISGINALIKGLNKLKIEIPDWVPSIGGGKLGFNIPLIPKLAKGGIVDRATLAMIGEAGREAVVPLENNTGWINELASKINGPRNGGGPRNITINQKFEKMETTRYALHRAKVETINAVKLAEAK